MFAVNFWNDQMDWVSNVVIMINMFLAFVAAIVNFWAARINPEPWKRVRFIVGCYSVIYVFGYAWLIVYEDLARWSSTMRGISLLVWPLVWIAPAWVSTKVWRDVRKKVQESLKETQESLEGDS